MLRPSAFQQRLCSMKFPAAQMMAAPLHAKAALKVRTSIAVYLHANLGLEGGWWSAQPPGNFTPARDPVPNEQEARCASGTVGMGPEYLASTGVRTPGRPACSESLYRLSHPGRLLRHRLHLKWYVQTRSPTSSKTDCHTKEPRSIAQNRQCHRLIQGQCLEYPGVK